MIQQSELLVPAVVWCYILRGRSHGIYLDRYDALNLAFMAPWYYLQILHERLGAHHCLLLHCRVVHDGAVFGISASMLEPGTGISDIQITADPAPPPVSIFAAAAAVADSAPAGEDSAPRSSEPHKGGKNKRANDARWGSLTAEEGARVQHDAADGLRPGKRRKGGEESLQHVSAASHAPGVSPTAAEATPPAAYVTKKELRLIRQAAAAAAVAAATATAAAGDAGGEGGGNMDHRENTIEVETVAAEVDQPVQSAESVPKAKGKKRKHARDDMTPSPAVDDSANQEAAGGSSLPAEECAADTSKRRKKHKGQVSDAAEHLIAAIPPVDAPIVANGFGDTAVKLSKKEKRKRQAEAEAAVVDSTTSVKKAKKAKTSAHIQAEVV